ncbi:hypothetical protein DL765_001415 [Monosporascus sp. GIB2]|nr:hypothetical protein DL765_001415 [Monosporascus sp. GIB2]
METEPFFPSCTSDPLGLPFDHPFDFTLGSSFSDNFDMTDLVNIGHADEDAVISPEGSEGPYNSLVPDSAATTPIQPSRETVTQDQPTNHVDPPTTADDSTLSSSPANDAFGPAQTSEGDVKETTTITGNEGNNKPSTLKPVSINRLQLTHNGPKTSQPATF